MRRTRWLLTVLLALGGWTFYSPPAHAGCVVETTGTYAEGTNLRDDKCDTKGARKVTLGGGASGSATAAAPTFAEASIGYFSWDLSGNLRVTQGTLLAGEDLVNNLLMVSGGAVRQTTMASAVTTNTTSTAVLVPTGTKGFYGQVVGTGAVTQTQALYCDIDNDAAYGVLLGTLTLTSTTRDQAIIELTIPCAYMYVTTTATTGTSATGAVYAQY